MIYTNETLKKMKKSKIEHTIRYANYYFRYAMSKEVKGTSQEERFLKKSNRLKDCLNLWVWNKYEKNKVLDLQTVNRCNDNKYCPNCRALSLSRAIHNFKPSFSLMLQKGYQPFLMTLTIPNVEGDKLKATIEYMNKAFSKFWLWFEQPAERGYRGFKERFFKMNAAIKVLEVTIEKIRFNYYHPHFHCIVFLPELDPGEINYLFDKYIIGPYSRKAKKTIYYSNADIHIMQLWKMAYDGLRLTNKNFSNMSDMWYDLYQCDIRPLADEKGIYEVFKYTFKDTDIKTYNQFITLFKALENKRIRQGHGELYNIELEADTGEKQDLEEFLLIDKKESPEQLLTQEITELITIYHDYMKISRFKAYEEINNVIENN